MGQEKKKKTEKKKTRAEILKEKGILPRENVLVKQ